MNASPASTAGSIDRDRAHTYRQVTMKHHETRGTTAAKGAAVSMPP
jgi:hypothetical protein